ncbi:MAG: NADH-quinone oxidoreductase subunit N [Elusimicrobia bacterium]|nr:NADH-quinone oxidoreductase subunit N [Elusimicrobiota bacterium]
MKNLLLLTPELLLAVLALGLLVWDMLQKTSSARLTLWLGVAALTLTLLAIVPQLSQKLQGVGSLWVSDPLGNFFKILILLATLWTLLLSMEDRSIPGGQMGLYAATLSLAALGMMLLVSATDLLLVFLSLELVSICSFILSGFNRSDPASSEGAMKYFLIGAFSSAMTLFGISLFYGATGTTLLTAMAPTSNPLLLFSLLFMLVGFGFKVSMVPFHFWVPDAYQGAPTPITAFLSIAPKAATLGLLLRIFTILLPHTALSLTMLFQVLAIATMTVGNLSAIFQTNMKRLLAYSSIAQAGYMLIGFVTSDPLGQEGVLLYAFTYMAMNLGAFAVAMVLAHASLPAEQDPYHLRTYDGLAQRSLGLSLLLTLFLLSLAGIPPTGGFIAKFYVFGAAIRSGFYALAVAGILNSVIAAYYYLRITYRMFFVSPARETPIPVGNYLATTVAFAAALTLAIGLYPSPFVESVKLSMSYLP